MKKKGIFSALALASVLCAGCAVDETVGKNESSKLYFDSWVTFQKQKHPEYLWQETALGSYILEWTEGTGASAGDPDDYPYVRYTQTTTDLDGNVASTTDALVSRKLNKYNKTYYYGPVISYRGQNNIYAGVEEILSDMKVGGRVKAVVPGWLLTYKRYSSASKYISNVTGTNAIYDITVTDIIDDIEKWEIDSLSRYIVANTDIAPEDSLKYGFYYRQLRAPSSDKAMPTDTTVYINYVGRLLNGLVFDTNVADSAKVYGLYSSSKTYKASQINMSANYTDITMSSNNSSVIDGFALALSQMKPFEKGRAIFWSGRGYTYNGSGDAIPAFSPLIFDIELVEKP